MRLSEKPLLHWRAAGRLAPELVLKNILEPLALPATGGFTVALVVFVLVCQLLGLGAPLRAVTDDSPTNLLQPARLEALAPFPVTGLEDSGNSGPHALLAVTTINSARLSWLRDLKGPRHPPVRRQPDLVLLFSYASASR